MKMKKLNIALLTLGFSKERKEATGITIMSYAKELKRLGHNVIIISSKKGFRTEILREYEKVDGIKIYRPYKSYIFGYAKAIDDVERKEKLEFDIIHNFSNAPVLALRAILSKFYAKKAMTIQTIKGKSAKIFGSLVFSPLLNLMDAVTVPTEFLKNKIKRYGCFKKVWIIRSHIDTSKFRPLNKEKLKKKYGYENKKIIFYYGAVRKESKGVEYLEEAAKSFENDRNVLFVFAPRNPEYIKDYGDLKGKNKRVVQNIDIVDYVNLADVIVLPYKDMKSTEGNPSCILEAMACKTPVITTNLDEINEIAVDREEVLMVNPLDSKDIAEKIKIMLNDKGLRERLIDNAYRKSKEFDIKKKIEEYLEIYEESLGLI